MARNESKLSMIASPSTDMFRATCGTVLNIDSDRKLNVLLSGGEEPIKIDRALHVSTLAKKLVCVAALCDDGHTGVFRKEKWVIKGSSKVIGIGKRKNRLCSIHFKNKDKQQDSTTKKNSVRGSHTKHARKAFFSQRTGKQTYESTLRNEYALTAHYVKEQAGLLQEITMTIRRAGDRSVCNENYLWGQ